MRLRLARRGGRRVGETPGPAGSGVRPGWCRGADEPANGGPMTTTSAIGAHHSAKPGSGVWLTPPGITQALGPFDLDPCGHPGWVTARELICPPRDGLAEHWAGRVWLNPPYREV